MKRRTYLAALGTTVSGALAGCTARSGPDDPPAGSLRFSNAHTLPHAVRLRVTAVGSELDDRNRPTGEVAAPPSQRDLSTTCNLSPGETATFPGVFTEPVWYDVAFTVDGQRPDESARVPFHPSPPGREYVNYLAAELPESGDFTWAVVTTDNPGSFTPGAQ